MILEMLADTGEFMNQRNSRLGQNILRADTAVHKNSGATNGTSSENDLLLDLHCLLRRPSVARIFNGICCQVPLGGGRVEENTSDKGVGHYGVVGTRR